MNAKFGSKYGSRIRKKVSTIEAKYKGGKQACPFCGTKAVERKAAGVFYCSCCKKKFAGGSYEPTTLVKRMLNKMYDKTGKAIKKEIDLKEIDEIMEKQNTEEE